MSRFDTIGAGVSRTASAQGRSAGRGSRRWPPVIALSAAAAVSAGLWVAIVAAVKALL